MGKVLKKSYQRCRSSFVIDLRNFCAFSVNFELLVLFTVYTSSTAKAVPLPLKGKASPHPPLKRSPFPSRGRHFFSKNYPSITLCTSLFEVRWTVLAVWGSRIFCISFILTF